MTLFMWYTHTLLLITYIHFLPSVVNYIVSLMLKLCPVYLDLINNMPDSWGWLTGHQSSNRHAKAWLKTSVEGAGITIEQPQPVFGSKLPLFGDVTDLETLDPPICQTHGISRCQMPSKIWTFGYFWPEVGSNPDRKSKSRELSGVLLMDPAPRWLGVIFTSSISVRVGLTLSTALYLWTSSSRKSCLYKLYFKFLWTATV